MAVRGPSRFASSEYFSAIRQAFRPMFSLGLLAQSQCCWQSRQHARRNSMLIASPSSTRRLLHT